MLPVARVYDGEDSWGELINPLDRARVLIENGLYTIEFNVDIVLNPQEKVLNQMHQFKCKYLYTELELQRWLH